MSHANIKAEENSPSLLTFDLCTFRHLFAWRDELITRKLRTGFGKKESNRSVTPPSIFVASSRLILKWQNRAKRELQYHFRTWQIHIEIKSHIIRTLSQKEKSTYMLNCSEIHDWHQSKVCPGWHSSPLKLKHTFVIGV